MRKEKILAWLLIALFFLCWFVMAEPSHAQQEALTVGVDDDRQRIPAPSPGPAEDGKPLRTEAVDAHGQSLAFSLDASAWVINPGTVQSIAYPFNGETGTMAFNFPRSPVSDPNDTGPWYGYVLQSWTAPISGSQLSITYKIKEARPDTTIFNFMSEPFNTCPAPAACRLYFQSGDIYNGDGWNRWWSNPIHAVLGPGRFTLTVPLNDPSQWSETFGRAGSANPSAFYATLARPSWVGVTFGGGCFFAHGVNTTGGKAQFQLLDFSSF